MLIRFRDSIHTPYIGSLSSYRHTRSNYCQYWGIIQHCIETGVRRFELGRSPKGSTHAQFKKKWGATPIEASYNYYPLKPNAKYRSAADPPRSYVLAARVWRRLPLTLTRACGHLFSRQIQVMLLGPFQTQDEL